MGIFVRQILLRSLKRQCHEIFWHFFSLLQPIWVPDKQSKMVRRKIRFREDIREKRNSAEIEMSENPK